jgi:hypothetical protein
MRSKDPEIQYRDKIRCEQKILEEFVAMEKEAAEDLLLYYRLRGQEIPDDEYRAAAFFKNREYVHKPGSLALLYSMYQRMLVELPPSTIEISMDLLTFRYRMYGLGLDKGGFS